MKTRTDKSNVILNLNFFSGNSMYSDDLVCFEGLSETKDFDLFKT